MSIVNDIDFLPSGLESYFQDLVAETKTQLSVRDLIDLFHNQGGMCTLTGTLLNLHRELHKPQIYEPEIHIKDNHPELICAAAALMIQKSGFSESKIFLGNLMRSRPLSFMLYDDCMEDVILATIGKEINKSFWWVYDLNVQQRAKSDHAPMLWVTVLQLKARYSYKDGIVTETINGNQVNHDIQDPKFMGRILFNLGSKIR